MDSKRTALHVRGNPIGMLAVLTVGIASVSWAGSGIWVEKPAMPTPRLGCAGAVVADKVYVMGGYAAANAGPLAAMEEYDPATNSWSIRAPMLTARRRLTAGAVNGRVYAIGGNVSLGTPPVSTVEEYDPLADTWTTKAPIPTVRFAAAAAAVDGKLYVIGGITRPSSGGATFSIAAVEVYDPATDTWDEKTPLPTARGILSASAVDGKIYVIGGITGGNPLAPGVPWVEMYDPETDTWTPRSDMPTGRSFLSTATVAGRIYAVGGHVAGVVTGAVEVYDPATDTWAPGADMEEGRWDFAVGAVNGRLYAIGGALTTAVPHPGVATVREYDPSPLFVDFDGNGTVDTHDLLKMIESWGQYDPVVDLAPRPFGDGIVDAADLEILMDYWGQTIDDPTLRAHWSFDEAEGAVASDNAGGQDAEIMGGFAWQPEGGAVGGALELNGMTLLVTDAVLNPSQGPFSVFAWVNGGAPGQVIISQNEGADWLVIDSVTGTLVTEIQSAGRFSEFLYSDALVTDGTWHRVGFIWDGSHRSLYADDQLVAEDASAALADRDGALNLGVGQDMGPETFWTGLIDDVRIYNRALAP